MLKLFSDILPTATAFPTIPVLSLRVQILPRMGHLQLKALQIFREQRPLKLKGLCKSVTNIFHNTDTISFFFCNIGRKERCPSGTLRCVFVCVS